MKWTSLIWNIPGNTWRAILAASPISVWMRFWVTQMVIALVVWLVLIIWKGPWTLAMEAKRLDWLGVCLLAGMFTILVCVVALFDFRLKFNATKEGLTADMAGEPGEGQPDAGDNHQ